MEVEKENTAGGQIQLEAGGIPSLRRIVEARVSGLWHRTSTQPEILRPADRVTTGEEEFIGTARVPAAAVEECRLVLWPRILQSDNVGPGGSHECTHSGSVQCASMNVAGQNSDDPGVLTYSVRRRPAETEPGKRSHHEQCTGQWHPKESAAEESCGRSQEQKWQRYHPIGREQQYHCRPPTIRGPVPCRPDQKQTDEPDPAHYRDEDRSLSAPARCGTNLTGWRC
jgi:hypothetical protein